MTIERARRRPRTLLVGVMLAVVSGCGGRQSTNLSPIADEKSELYRNVRAETEALQKAQAEAEKRAFQKLKPAKSGH